MAARKPVYFKEPKVISWKEARKLPRIPRDANIIVEPKVPKTTLDRISVSITEEGVFVPYYRKGPDGKIEMAGHRRYPDLPTAVRGEWEKIGSVKDDDVRYVKAYKTLALLHSDIHNNWGRKSEAEKEDTVGQVRKLRDSIARKRILTEMSAVDRKDAVDAIENLLDGMRTGRIRGGAVPTVLVRVKNRLVARRGDLFRQLRYIPRRRSLLVRKKIEMDWSAFELLDRINRIRERAEAAGTIPKEHREAILRNLRGMQASLQKRIEPELKNVASKHAGRASVHIRGGDLPKALGHLDRASKAITTSLSRYAWLYPGKLVQVAGSPDKGFKRRVAANQVQLYHDNLEYWLSEASHEPLAKSHIIDHMGLIGSILPGTRFEGEMQRAAGYLGQGMMTKAKETMGGILEQKLQYGD